MPRTDTEELVVSLEAKVRDFERNFARATRTADRSFRQIERSGDDAAKRLEATFARAGKGVASGMATVGKAAGAALLGGLAVAGVDQIVDRLGSIVRGVADVGREAKRAGVSIRSFQELGHVAAQARIGTDELVDGLKELNLRADEFVATGAGPAEEAFTRLGYSASDLKEALREPDELFVQIIARMGELDRAAQIRVADEIFGGTAGERFVELVAKGEAGIRGMIDEAHDFGLVLDDELVAKAEELDRRFAKWGRTIEVNAKGAILEAIDALDQFLDKFRAVEQRADATIENRLRDIYQRRFELEGKTADGGGGRARAAMLRELQELTDEALRLRDVLDRRMGYPGAESAGDAASDATPKVERLTSATDGAGRSADQTSPKLDELAKTAASAGTAGTNGASGFQSFADAIRALKGEIPGLTEQLAELDAQARIEQAYQGALRRATSIGDTYVAEGLRNEALNALGSKSAREAASRSFLDLIGFAEGTDKGRGYNESLGYGAFTGGPQTLTHMTLDQIDALQIRMLRHPNNNFNSSALGRYQIVQKTLRGLRGELGLSGGELFDADMQDRLARQLMRRRGNNVAGLRNEWEGLRRVDGSIIQSAFGGSAATGAFPARDPELVRREEEARREAERAREDAAREQERAAKDAARERERAAEEKARGVEREKTRRVDEATRQADAYRSIIEEARAFTQEQGVEQQALSMTTVNAAALRYEHQMLSEAQRAGITLTQQQRDEIGRLAQGMAQAETATTQYAETQQQANEVSQFFGQQAVDALSGIITGTTTAEQALKQLVATLVKAALQAAILGEGPLASLFRGGGPKVGGTGGKGKVGGGIFGAMLGFADGGFVRGPGGPREDRVVARLSPGEYVVNAAATRKHRATLEAINAGRIPAFRDGGIVGTAPPRLAGPNVTSSSSATVTINAPIKVEGSSGTPEQNADLAKKMKRELEGTMRGMVASELREHMRPGNILGRR